MISRRVSCPAIRFFRQEKITMLKAALIHVIIVLVLVTPFFNKGLGEYRFRIFVFGYSFAYSKRNVKSKYKNCSKRVDGYSALF